MEQGSHEREQESNKGALPDESPVQSDTVEEVPSEIGQVLIPESRAKLDAPIKVEMTASPGGRAYFSIAQFPRGFQVTMAEDPENPGHYWGEYIAQVGDRVEDAEITVVFTDDRGTISTRTADERVAIDTIPPTLREVKVTPLVRNEGMTEIEVETKPNSEVKVDVSQLDTTAGDVVLKEVQTKPGTYRGQFTISKDNNAKNGIKLIDLSVTDELGNEGEGVLTSIELRNSELSKIVGITPEQTEKLEAEGIYTLSDLRNMDIQAVAGRNNLQAEQLEKYRVSACLQTIGTSKEFAHVLVDLGGISSALELVFYTEQELIGFLPGARSEGFFAANLGLEVVTQTAKALIDAATALIGVVVEYYLGEQVLKANKCQISRKPEKSWFSCYAYLLELLQEAGINISNKYNIFNGFKGIFKWDLSDDDFQITRRSEICVSLFREHETVREDPENFYQAKYDTALYYELIGITGKTENELRQDDAFVDVFNIALINERNGKLQKILEQNQDYQAHVKQVLKSLKHLELEALIKQSDMTEEALREKYYLSFAPQDCQDTTKCQLAILCVQEYLSRQFDKNKDSTKKPFPSYDEWRQQESKERYPENSYSHEFKLPLIQDGREKLKSHVKQAYEALEQVSIIAEDQAILDEAKLLDYTEREKPEFFLNSPKNQGYYMRLKTAIGVIDRCIKIDDYINLGHYYYHHEEYQLAKSYYFRAAKNIRDACYTLSSQIAVPKLTPNESEINLDSQGQNETIWMPTDTLSDSLFRLNNQQKRERCIKFLLGLHDSYSANNVPGGVQGQTNLILTAVERTDGSFKSGSHTTIHPSNNAGREAWLNFSGGWIKYLASQEWIFHNFFDSSPAEYDYFCITPNGELVSLYTNDNFRDEAHQFIALEYMPCRSLQDYTVTLECHRGTFKGIAVRWANPNKFIAILFGYYEDKHGLFQGVLETDRKNRKYTFKEGEYSQVDFSINNNIDARYKLIVTVNGDDLLSELFLKEGASEKLVGTPLRSKIPAQYSRGTFAILSLGKGRSETFQGPFPSQFHWGRPFTITFFDKIEVVDKSLQRGSFSDLFLFLKPLETSDRDLMFNKASHIYQRGGEPVFDYEERVDIASSKVDDLKSAVSISYGLESYIVQSETSDYQYDIPPLFGAPSDKSIYLWYERGSNVLDRQKMRAIIDRLPNLFVHQYFFILPICLGDIANAQGLYEEALNWYRVVYDEREKDINKQPYPFLNDKIEVPMMRQRISKNFLDWADHFFQINTQESVQEGRRKYKKVLELLDADNCCGVLLEKEVKSVSESGTGGFQLPYFEESHHFIIWKHVVQYLHYILVSAVGLPAQSYIPQLNQKVNAIVNLPISGEEKVGRVQDLLAKERQKLFSPIGLNDIVLDRVDLQNTLVHLEKQYPEILDRYEQAGLFIQNLIPDTEPVVLKDTVQFHEPSDEAILPQREDSITTDLTLENSDIRGLLQTSDNKRKTLTVIAEHKLIPRPGISLPDRISFDEFSINVANRPKDFLCIKRPIPSEVSKADLPGILASFSFEPLPNPYSHALVQRACRGIHLIDHCFNVVGLPRNGVSFYRFDYLISLAKNFSNLALSAEKDFMQFKEKFESNSLEMMDATQAVTRAQANVQLADLQLQEAANQIVAAQQQIESIHFQIQLVQKRLDEVGTSGWVIFGIVCGAVAATASAFFSAGSSLGLFATAATGVFAKSAIAGGSGLIAGAGVSISGGAANAAGVKATEQGLEQQLQKLRNVDLPAAQLNLSNSLDHYRSVQQQVHIARIEAEFMAERATFLTYQFFNPQLWGFLAREMKKYYRTYVQYGTIAAWLAQRALQFERGIDSKRRFAQSWPHTDRRDASLDIIRFDYFQAPQQGLLAADSLIRDIATLEQEKFLSDQRKLKITKVISLAQTRPLEYAHFLNTGQLYFGTSLREFDLDYPGHYQRRIKEVRVNVFGLIGQEGIKATLTHLGPSVVVVREERNNLVPEEFVEKTLSHPMAVTAMTNPQPGGIGKVTLAPEEPQLKPFEGKGVAGNWVFEMLKMSNAVNFNTITDIQLVIEYTALYDASYRQEVIAKLPKQHTGIRPYSFCAEFSDACFHLKEGTRPIGMIETSDGTTGAHTLVFQTRDTDFAPNQNNLRLKEVVVYIRSKDDTDFSGLQLYLSCGQRLAKDKLTASALTLVEPVRPSNATMVEAETPRDTPADIYNPAPHYLGKWQVEKLIIRDRGAAVVDVADTWYLHIPPAHNQTFIKKNKDGQDELVDGQPLFDFSQIQDVIFALSYEYELDIPT